MRFSRSLKSSTQSLPSPDGAFIATVLPSKLSIRATRSLEITRVISLPPELASSISWFLWSESSNRILVGSSDNIRVFSTQNPNFSANINHPTSGTTKATFVCFGANDDEILVFSDFGLKLSVFNFSTQRSVDINSPKFYNAGVAAKGFSYRPVTSNLALLTRSGGKDVVSIHAKDTLDVTRSWWPDTIDAHGICWSADGRWLVVWESSSQGHKILVYTADGHLFKTWNGPVPISEEDSDIALGAGIKVFDWSRNGAFVAVGDYSRRVTILSAPSFTETTSLFHTTTVKPAESLQIWQEQIVPSPNGGFSREFVAATQAICPPTSGSSPPTNAEPKTGTNFTSFDTSGSLLATRMENMPTTIWIWDLGTRVLRAVMILHAPIAKATWHPTIDELLMIRCEGEESRGLVHLWDPSWSTPKIVDFAAQIPGGKVIGKTIGRWLNAQSGSPAIFFSDSQDCILASIPGSEDEEAPWQDAEVRGFDIYGQQEESPLNLVPADGKRIYSRVSELMDDGLTGMSGGTDEVEDTFRFRKFIEPDPWSSST
ncbi:uncharacterized protein K444DRAFT_624293 [Hyaloscypha bicolor E]|uniref:WD40 repeat-like protein n=1 Tax=Hyaloscypha bicolor E TaxID=1095630 RepID=A0A2J6TUW5_9HELO|nr:uncharacterized protein K444DRAFT_624293 [Hyaloscypha bicolor E]PMD66819.1 hypothetical protein K444DRAFT_624293 [Hyaloscypha bicolor E]